MHVDINALPILSLKVVYEIEGRNREAHDIYKS